MLAHIISHRNLLLGAGDTTRRHTWRGSPKEEPLISQADMPAAEPEFAAHGLVRPECVLCLESGRLIVSNFDGGISVVEPNGEVWHHLCEAKLALKPNGICLEEDGSVLLAHLGDTDGGVYRLREDGLVEPFLLEVDGASLPPTNFVVKDAAKRVWITISTRRMPRDLGYRRDGGDGFVVLVDDKGARIVADGIGYANECMVHPDGKRLFVNETFAKRVTIFDIHEDGVLNRSTEYTDFREGEFPDGLAFDENGDAWVACIVSNRILRFSADGKRTVVLDGADKVEVAEVEKWYGEGQVPAHVIRQAKGKLGNLTSLAFGGADRRTIYMGNLLNDRLPLFRQQVAGAKPPHWHFAGPKRRARATRA